MDMPEAVADHEFFCKDIPEPYQILGLKLLPLSIGRYRRMARHGIGFVSESKSKVDGIDLIVGILICSMSCKSWDILATSDELPKMVKKWLKQIHASPPFYLRGKMGIIFGKTWIGRRWRKSHSFDLFEKCNLFKNYLQKAQEFPKFLIRQQSDRTSISHWSKNIEVVLMGELNWGHDHIDELPLSKAIEDYCKHMENNGVITMLTDADFEQVRNNDAAIKKAMEDWALNLIKKGKNGL